MSLKRAALAAVLLIGFCVSAPTGLNAQTAGLPQRFARVKCGIGANQVSLLPSPGGTPPLAVLSCNEQVEILSVGERWYELKTGDGKVGYVSRFFLQEGTAPVISPKPIFEKQESQQTEYEQVDPSLPLSDEPSQLIMIPPRARSNGGLRLPDYGKESNSVRMLTPDEGVDFSKYLDGVVASVKRKWYAVMPASALNGDKGRVTIQFRILRDGSVEDCDESTMIRSGSSTLDQAAIASIHGSAPFEALLHDFKGPYIELRFTFLYNLPLSAANQ